MTTVSAQQVAQEVLDQGGSQIQAQVAAALVSGIESNGELNDQNPTSTASGLFQFLTTTWASNGGTAYSPTAGAANLQQQVDVFLKASAGNNFEPWAPDLGGSYNGQPIYAPLPGSPVANKIASLPAADFGPAMTQQDWEGLATAVQQGGGAYLAAAQQQAQASASVTGVAAGSTTGTAASTGGTPGDTSTEGSAISQIDTTLQQYGLGSLAGWAWGELTTGKNSDQIMLDLQNQPAYESSIFGTVNKARVAGGLAPMTPADILTYQDQAFQYAQAAGLPQGFIDQTTITNLLGHDVSASELNQRLTSGYEAAMNAPAETRNLLSQYFGVNTGDLAAYYLDPTKAESLLKNQLVAAEVGTQAAQSGFGALTAANATNLASELSAQGKVNPSGSGQWDVSVGSTFANIAPLAGLEQALPGMGAAAPAVTQGQLLDYGFLSKGQENVQRAVETRKAFASGGGGEDISAYGVTGTGNASSQGTKLQQETGG